MKTNDKEEDNLRMGWNEETKKFEIIHICPVCNVLFYGRRNKVYCSERCSKTAEMRRRRLREKEPESFKPHRNTYGGIMFLSYNPILKKKVVSTVPKYEAEEEERTLKWIDAHFLLLDEEVKEKMKKQIKEVFRNEKQRVRR